MTTDTYMAVTEEGIPEEIQEVLKKQEVPKKKELNSHDSRTRCPHYEDPAREGVSAATTASFPGNPSLHRTLVLMVLNYFQAGQFYGLAADTSDLSELHNSPQTAITLVLSSAYPLVGSCLFPYPIEFSATHLVLTAVLRESLFRLFLQSRISSAIRRGYRLQLMGQRPQWGPQ